MKKLVNLKGVITLNNKLQKSIIGGGTPCTYQPNGVPCPNNSDPHYCCWNGRCQQDDGVNVVCYTIGG
jgi:hypothetical protein